MSYTPENIAEIEVLMLFKHSTNQEGIKVHKNAEPAVIVAAQSLYGKGFVTQADGGYLTGLGHEAAEHAQSLFTMLNAHSAQCP